MNISTLANVLPDLHIVGGTVRDQIMNVPSNDHDLRFYATGEDHGTLTFIIDGIPIEATTFRKDVSTDGRRATVAWADTIEEDLARRDFTINAMAQNVKTGEIIDPFGGKQDIERKLIRAVGDADTRIREDLLRVARAARFMTRFEFEIADDLKRAMHKHGPSVTNVVSIERLVSETNKAFKQSDLPSTFFRTLLNTGVLNDFMSNIAMMQGLKQNPTHHPEGDVFEHTMHVIDNTYSMVNESGWDIARWAALYHDVGKVKTFDWTGSFNTFHNHDVVGADMIIPGIAERLHLPNDLASVMKDVARHHMYPMHAQNFDVEMKHVRRFQSNVKHLNVLKNVCIADSMGKRPDTIDKLFQPLKEPVTPVLMGRHLIDAGYEPGPKFSTMLDAAFEHQLDTGTKDIDVLLSVAEVVHNNNH